MGLQLLDPNSGPLLVHQTVVHMQQYAYALYMLLLQMFNAQNKSLQWGSCSGWTVLDYIETPSQPAECKSSLEGTNFTGNDRSHLTCNICTTCTFKEGGRKTKLLIVMIAGIDFICTSGHSYSGPELQPYIMGERWTISCNGSDRNFSIRVYTFPREWNQQELV